MLLKVEIISGSVNKYIYLNTTSIISIEPIDDEYSTIKTTNQILFQVKVNADTLSKEVNRINSYLISLYFLLAIVGLLSVILLIILFK